MHFSHADPTKVNVSSLCISLRFFEQCKFPQYLSEHHLSINQQSGLCNFCISSPMLKLWNANTHDFRIGNYRRSRQLPIQLIQASKESIYLWSSKIIVPIYNRGHVSFFTRSNECHDTCPLAPGRALNLVSVSRTACTERATATDDYIPIKPSTKSMDLFPTIFRLQQVIFWLYNANKLRKWVNSANSFSLARSRYLEPMLGCVHRRRVFTNILL